MLRGPALVPPADPVGLTPLIDVGDAEPLMRHALRSRANASASTSRFRRHSPPPPPPSPSPTSPNDHMFVVQVGAHGHRDTSYHNTADQVPKMIAKGATALLIEPQTYFADLLRRTYADNPGVRVVNQAVCSKEKRKARFYSVRLDNPSTYGSLHADGRCANKTINAGSTSGWITEIASLSKNQVMKQAYLFSYSPKQCRACSSALEHALPDNCMKNIVRDNLQESIVSCVQWNTLLPPGKRVDFLMIDVEGHERSVISSFPFRENPVRGVKFETKHLSTLALNDTRSVLAHQGFVMKKPGVDETWQAGVKPVGTHLQV